MSLAPHSGLRYVFTRALLDAAPSLLLSALLLYGLLHTLGTQFTIFLGFALGIMLFVAIGRMSSHISWVARASQLITRGGARPMLLTASAGWKDVTLQPATPEDGTPTISNLTLITKFSGVPLTEQQSVPVEAYLDEAFTDLIVIHIGDYWLCSEVKQRFEQGHTTPVLQKTPTISATQTSGGAEVRTNPSSTLDNPHIAHDIEALAADARQKFVIVSIAGILMIAACLWVTGCYHILTIRPQFISDPIATGEHILFVLVFCAIVVSLVYRMYRYTGLIRRGSWVITQTVPVLHHISAERAGKSQSAHWIINVSASDRQDSPLLFSLKLLVDIDETKARAIDNTAGLVYTTGNPKEPVVIQSVNGVLIGTVDKKWIKPGVTVVR